MSPRRNLSWVVVWLTLLATATVAHAVSGIGINPAVNDTLPVYEMDSILVIGEPPMPITVTQERLLRSELTQRNATSLAGALPQVPGVTVSTGYKNTAEVRLRGSAAENVLVLIDGNPINPGYYGKADLSLLPLSAVAAVDVAAGPSSVGHGPNAAGGVVNIITHSGRSESGLSLRARYGSADLRDLECAFGGKRETWDYRLTFYDTRSHGFDLAAAFDPTSVEDGGRRDNSDFARTGINAKAVLRRTPAGMVTAAGGLQWGEKGLPSDIHSPRWWRMTGIQHHHGSVELASVRRATPLPAERSVTFFYDAWEDRLTEYKDRSRDPNRVEWVSDLENWTAGARTEWRADAVTRWLKARWGGSLKKQGMNKKPDLDEPWASHSAWDGQLFGEFEAAVGSRLTLLPGFAVAVHDAEEADGLSHSIDPLFAMRWSPSPSGVVSASVSRASRFPTLHQLYSETSGNPELGPETVMRWEIGGEMNILGEGRQPHVLSLRAAIFGNHSNNAIIRTGRLDRYANHAAAVTGGTELGLKAAGARYTVRADYAYLESFDGDPTVLIYVPNHKVSLTTHWEPDRRWRVDLMVLHAGSRLGREGRDQLSPYTVCDVKLTSRVTGHASCHLGSNNVLDANYEEESGFPAPGRQVTAGVELTF